MKALLTHLLVTTGMFFLVHDQLTENIWINILLAFLCGGNLFWLPYYRDWVIKSILSAFLSGRSKDRFKVN